MKSISKPFTQSFGQQPLGQQSFSQQVYSIFEVLEKFKEEVVKYLDNATRARTEELKKTKRWSEYFVRWYLTSLEKGANNYFLPFDFVVNKEDIEYNKDLFTTVNFSNILNKNLSASLSNNLTDKDVVQKVIQDINHIWEHFKKLPCELRSNPTKKLTEFHEERLKELYNGPNDKFQWARNLIISAYEFIGFYAGAIPPELFEKYNVFELFGNPFNTYYDYCSPLQFEKEYFSSKGSFFDFQPFSDVVYLANPSYNDSFMNRMADKLLQMLDSTKNIEILVFIPVYDRKTQKTLRYRRITDKPYEAYDKLYESKYKVSDNILRTEKYQMWNYDEERFISFPLPLHLLVLKNSKSNLIDIPSVLKEWETLSNE
jgi:hypothetical protein